MPSLERAARDLSAHLAAGGALPRYDVADLALFGEDLVHADVVCGTARFYATAVHYPQRRFGYVDHHPTFGPRWVGNPALEARHRREAERAAAPQWREHEQNRVVLTSAGLRVASADSWVPFDHELLAHLHREPNGHHLVLTYHVCPPLRLSGPAAPWLSVAIAHLGFGPPPARPTE